LFAIFLLAGLAGTWWLLIRPTLKVVAARTWNEVPCRILASEVRSHRDDDGPTYRVDIFYEYQVNGQRYWSSRYHFLTGSSSGYEGKRALVRRYPAGTTRSCFVNPANPDEAVLHRGFTPMMLAGLIPLVFLVVGAGGMIYSRRSPTAPAPAPTAPGGPVELKPRVSPVGGLLGIILVGLFWNGIVAVFLLQVWRGFQSGRPDWFLTVFMIPFVVIGLGFVGGVIYQFLALFNPRPHLTLSAGAVALGESLDLRWRMDGNPRVIERLHIWLEGHEEIRYRSGKNDRTEKETFAQIELTDTTRHSEVAAGRAPLQVPADTMHSFESGGQKIVWTLHLRGHIKFRPDVRLEYPLTVRPRP
jgi:hypothetical protein